MEEDSGRLWFTDDCLRYESKTYGTWRLEAACLRLIGEFTNESGPYLDDYFLVFFRRGENGWCEASFYARGRDEVLKLLAARFPGFSNTALADSADFKSRVLWPAEHAGKPLFDFRPIKRGERWHDRLLDRIFPPFMVESALRSEWKEPPIKSPETTRGT